MSAKGRYCDNAAQESFYGRCESSSVGEKAFLDETAAARSLVFVYTEIFRNCFRKHSSLGCKNPVEFEEQIAPPMEGKGASLQACIEHD